MTESTMPAAEAAVVTRDDERNSYEFAFHVLPTVAEGEVASVFGELKALVEKHGGSVTLEEMPQRFDLAYDISKYLEGKYRKFRSAYFGWIRFTMEPAQLEALTEDIDIDKRLLRYLLIKLTRVEEENPFYFHEAVASKKVRTITDEEVVESDDSDSAGDDTDEAATADESADDSTDEEADDQKKAA